MDPRIVPTYRFGPDGEEVAIEDQDIFSCLVKLVTVLNQPLAPAELKEGLEGRLGVFARERWIEEGFRTHCCPPDVVLSFAGLTFECAMDLRKEPLEPREAEFLESLGIPLETVESPGDWVLNPELLADPEKAKLIYEAIQADPKLSALGVIRKVRVPPPEDDHG